MSTARDAGSSDQDVERFGYHQELKRSLSFADLLIYGLIFMVPIAFYSTGRRPELAGVAEAPSEGAGGSGSVEEELGR